MDDPYNNSPSMWNSSTQCNIIDNTTLCLNSHYSGPTKRKLNLRSDISLTLGLGSSGSYLETENRFTTGINLEEQSLSDVCLEFDLSLGSKRACKEARNTRPTLCALARETPRIDLGLSLSTSGATESDVTSVTLASSPVQLVDEGSTSSKWKKGLILPLLLDAKPPRKTAVKTCQFPECEKGARGASGYCISHGGGRRCQRFGCSKGAEGRTAFCKAHGGGRRCEHLGCTKSAEGRTNLCIAHGGGKRCGFQGGCARAARGRTGFCIRHGGGKRCKIENCTKSAEGLTGLCIAHGGGRRCGFPGCGKGAQGGTKFCKAHGGGKRCSFLGCTKGAEGSTPFCKAHGGGKRCSFNGGGVCSKSVHGGTLFCVSHGGGKRCAVLGCTKSARGRTRFCVRHGGGKRCKFEGCEKGAQGSTDYCKAHGGGKRCSWGLPGSCGKFARGKIGLCAAHTAQVQDKRVHGKGTVSLAILYGLGLVPPIEFRGSCSTLGSLPEGRVHGGSLMAMLRGAPGPGPDPGP